MQRLLTIRIAAALCLSFSCSSPCAAHEPTEAGSSRQEAKRLRDLGVQAVDRGDFAEAVDDFRRAYALFPSPNLHFNIAVALDSEGRSAEALQAFEDFLAAAPDTPTDARAFAKARSVELEASVARLEVGLSPADAALWIDDRSLSPESPRGLPLSAGEHQVVARKTGYTSATERIVLGAGERRRVELTLNPLRPPALANPSPSPPPVNTASIAPPISHSQAVKPVYKKWWFWTATAAGVALAATAISVGVYESRPIERVFQLQGP